MNKTEHQEWVQKALAVWDAAQIALTPEERKNVEIADFGLSDFARTGLTLVTYLNTDCCCVKEMVLHPGQTCPEHRHPPLPKLGSPGKEETFRCRSGMVYLYVAGEPTPFPACQPPSKDREYYTVWRQIRLEPGEQFTLFPNTLHWFQGGAARGCGE